ncbi:MAG TPA: ATP-binding protein, partial [Bacteroidia bacterium]|nr:ATP-binding protein [Bacteroidia bacterium]
MEKNGIKKIAVIGAESTGKTWLCEALAKHYQTVFVPEYARDYFNDSDIYNYTLNDLVLIAKKQLELENENILKARRFLFCDTTLITLKIWAELEFEQTPPFIESQLAEVEYDHYFLTDNEIPWTEDGLRQNKHSRDLLFQMNETEIKNLKIAYS